MISPNAELMQCTALGVLPGQTALNAFAPDTFGCRAKCTSNDGLANIWEVTLEKALPNGTFLFFWGPTVAADGVGTQSSTTVTISGSSTDKVKQVNLNNGEGDICFAFYQALNISS